jgi:hypothetical protein
MNGEIKAAEKLLGELWRAYQGLPQHIKMHVKHLLRGSSLQQQTGDERAS